jgi:phosphonate transport system ATP-binding protein
MAVLPTPKIASPDQIDGYAAKLSDVVFHYPGQDKPALSIERLTILKGERIALIGPSGGGKTTLLRLLNGALRSSVGVVDVLGEPLKIDRRMPRDYRRRIGLIPQGFALIERATVMDNVLSGRLGYAHPWLSLFGAFSEEDRKLASEAIAEVDLTAFAHRRVDGLSGGQRQRVAIARVLAQGPDVILADEPVSQLDPALTEEMISLLTEASERRDTTLVMAVHQPALAVAHMERIVAIRDGSILFDGPATCLRDDIRSKIYDRDTGHPSH